MVQEESANSPTDVIFVTLNESNGWRIRKNRLLDISLAEASHFITGLYGFSVWDLYFVEDLIVIENAKKGIVLDVGWYPHADPSGEYRLVLLNSSDPDSFNNAAFSGNWDRPIIDYHTRSLPELLVEIRNILSD